MRSRQGFWSISLLRIPLRGAAAPRRAGANTLYLRFLPPARYLLGEVILMKVRKPNLEERIEALEQDMDLIKELERWRRWKEVSD